MAFCLTKGKGKNRLMIRNIVFDMGNVLIHFNRQLFMERLNVKNEDMSLLMREVFLSLEWAQMDRGTLTDAEAEQIIRKRVPEHLGDAVGKLVSMWERPILPVEGMEELIRELKENGYGIYLLSNASLRQHDYWPRVPAAKYFDGTLISADVKLVKPQPEIYHYLCEKYSLKMDECVFIDDSASNAEGAVFAGMPAVVFFDAKTLRRDLHAMGVNCHAE